MYNRVDALEPSVRTNREPFGAAMVGAPVPAAMLIPPRLMFSNDGFSPFATGILMFCYYLVRGFKAERWWEHSTLKPPTK